MGDLAIRSVSNAILQSVPQNALAVRYGGDEFLILILIYIFTITKTEYRTHQLKWRIVLWLPYAVPVAVLLQNFFTNNVFVVDGESGYSRGPLLIV